MELPAHAVSQETPGNVTTPSLVRHVVPHPPHRRPRCPSARLPLVSIPTCLPQSDPSLSPTIGSDLPSLSTIFQASCPTLRHVPKGARDRWARAFSECLSAMCDAPADLSRWSKLLMLAKCVLASRATGHRLRWREILTLCRSRIDRWLAGDIATLWPEAMAGGKSLAKRIQSSSGSQRSHNIRRAKLAVQDGQYSKAIEALTSNGLATPSAEVLGEMLNKHPQASLPTLPPGPVPPPLNLSETAVKRGVRSFPNGSAPGPSGLRPSHLPGPSKMDPCFPHQFRQPPGGWSCIAHNHPTPLCCLAPRQQEEEWRPSPHCRRGGAGTSGIKVPCLPRTLTSHLFARPTAARSEYPGRMRSNCVRYLPSDDIIAR